MKKSGAEKFLCVVPDGAADRPVARLDGKTPLQAARTPNMDRLAREGLLGVTRHVPSRMTPGSSVAMMSLMGYDPLEHFTGRGPLEAADLGLRMDAGDWAFRCNLITAGDDVLADFTAGHLSTEEAEVLIEALNRRLGTDEISFHVGTGYRHVMMDRGSEPFDLETVPPHDIVDGPLRDNYPQGEGADRLVELMDASCEVLEGHEVNEVRVDLGKNPANMIWLWSPGQKPMLDNFEALFGVRGAVISAVNLVRGIGRLIGWDVVHVPGATGYVDTDYAAKGRYAVDALDRYDLVLVHVEATDEASHEKDVKAKIRAIERIDREIVGPALAHAEGRGNVRIMVVPDHLTTVEDGRHRRGYVPFAIWGSGVRAESGVVFTEATAEAAEVVIEDGSELMEEFLGVHPDREARWQ